MFFLATYYNCPKLIAPTIKFIKYLVSTIFILVPIALVIMGSLDFGKAVVAKEEGEIKKAQTIFIKRVITGVSIFFIFSLVSLAMKIVSDSVNSTTNKYSWTKCWNDPMGTCAPGEQLFDGTCKDSACVSYNGNNYTSCKRCVDMGRRYDASSNRCVDNPAVSE